MKPDFKNYYTNHPEIHTSKVDVVFPESVVRYSKLQCNDDRVMYTNMPEIKHLEEILSSTNPKNVLEIGGGIGRASVYFSKRYGWEETNFYMLDGNSGDTQICPVAGKGQKDFYNSFAATEEFCQANGIDKNRLFLLDADNNEWENLPIKFDLIYSFLSIGFHWSIHLYLDRLHKFCTPNTRLIFGMRGTDRGDEFAVEQVKGIDPNMYDVTLNIRESELYRTSVLVLQPKI